MQKIALPITKLLRKDNKFEWTDACQHAFDKLRGKLNTYPVMRPSRWNLSFHVFYNASMVAVGNALCQPTEIEDKNQLVAFASR